MGFNLFITNLFSSIIIGVINKTKMNSVGSASPMMGSPQTRSPKPFKSKAHGIVAGSIQKGPMSPNKRKIIDLTSSEADQDLDKLERDLQKLVQTTNADGTDQDEGVKKLIGANQQFLNRVKTLQSAIGDKIN